MSGATAEARDKVQMAERSKQRVPALEARDIVVRFGAREVLNLPFLEVDTGEVVAIMGPNGAGKSTLLLCLALLQRPAAGEIRVDGELIRWGGDTLHWRRQMAVVFQEPLLLDTSVQENVAIGLKLRGQKGAQAARTAQLWLERFGIAHLAQRQARDLSGGEARRVSLARAFAVGPKVLLLDEPFAALDQPTRSSLIGDFRDVLGETGVTTLLVTHDRDEALAIADRVGILINGRLRQIGTVEDVFSSPTDAEVAAFVGIETVMHGHIVGEDEGVAAVQISIRGCANAGQLYGRGDGPIVEAVSALPVGSEVLVCLRPEDVTLLRSLNEVQFGSARNHLCGKVTRIAPTGVQVRVTVDCGFPVVALVTRRSASEMGLDIGADVVVSFKASALHLIPKR